MAIQTGNITLDGLVHTLDDRDRVAAQLVMENTAFPGQSSPYIKHVQYVDNERETLLAQADYLKKIARGE